MDGNITTLIAALVLGILGSGSVKGFAYTLAMGIVLSMFTALVISRSADSIAFYALGLQETRNIMVKPKERKPIDFLGKRKICFIISIVTDRSRTGCHGNLFRYPAKVP